MKCVHRCGFQNREKTREFQSIQSKIRKMGMRKTHEIQGGPLRFGHFSTKRYSEKMREFQSSV